MCGRVQAGTREWVVTDPTEDGIIGLLQTAVTNAISTMMNNITSSITGLQTSLNEILTKRIYAGSELPEGAGRRARGHDRRLQHRERAVPASIRSAQVRDQHILRRRLALRLTPAKA